MLPPFSTVSNGVQLTMTSLTGSLGFSASVFFFDFSLLPDLVFDFTELVGRVVVAFDFVVLSLSDVRSFFPFFILLGISPGGFDFEALAVDCSSC